MTVRVLITDDQEMVRVGFPMILDHQLDIEVVADMPDGPARADRVRDLRSDVMRGRVGGDQAVG